MILGDGGKHANIHVITAKTFCVVKVTVSVHPDVLIIIMDILAYFRVYQNVKHVTPEILAIHVKQNAFTRIHQLKYAIVQKKFAHHSVEKNVLIALLVAGIQKIKDVVLAVRTVWTTYATTMVNVKNVNLGNMEILAKGRAYLIV